MVQQHPVRLFAHKECNGSDASGDDAAASVAGVFKRCRMRREPAPADSAGERELIQDFGIVVDHAARQNLALPGARGNFKALQLAQDFKCAAFGVARNLGARRNVLPAQEPAHKLRGSHGFDLLAQAT